MKIIINVVHISDGFLITRTTDAVPRKGEWIVLSSDTYEVKQVIWNYNDARSVTLMVEEPTS